MSQAYASTKIEVGDFTPQTLAAAVEHLAEGAMRDSTGGHLPDSMNIQVRFQATSSLHFVVQMIWET